MERKIKKAIALSAVAVTVMTAVPSAICAEADSTESFPIALECDDILMDNISDCTVNLTDGRIQIDVTINQTYTPENLKEITGQAYPCIWFNDESGIVWNPEECYLSYSCGEMTPLGSWRVIQKTFLYPDGINSDGRYYTIFRKNDNGLLAGEHFGCTVSVLENVPQTTVKVFGRDFVATNSLLEDAPENAPAPVDTANEETVPEMSETFQTTVDMSVLSNLKGIGTDVAEDTSETESETQVTESQVTSSETTTTTTVTETTMTVTETAPVIQKMQESVSESAMQTSFETTETTTDETTEMETEQKWKVVQVMMPTEITEETSEPKKEFPIIPAIAGNAVALLIGFLVKVKFF